MDSVDNIDNTDYLEVQQTFFREKSIQNEEINNFSLQELQKTMLVIVKKMETIEQKLDTIETILQNDISKKCDKMEQHIDFVDNVYSSVKKPLGYLCGKVNSFVGFGYGLTSLSSSSNNILELPDIDNKDSNNQNITTNESESNGN
jgi:hypothetical protein